MKRRSALRATEGERATSALLSSSPSFGVPTAFCGHRAKTSRHTEVKRRLSKEKEDERANTETEGGGGRAVALDALSLSLLLSPGFGVPVPQTDAVATGERLLRTQHGKGRL